MRSVFTLLQILTVFGLSSCLPDRPEGMSSIEARVEHHGRNIPRSTVYIKYNVKGFPGHDVSVYDDKRVLSDTGHLATHVHFTELEDGNYFLYAVGYDSTIAMQVTGGVDVKLGKAEEREVTVPVSE